MPVSIAQFFQRSDYLMALPMILLTIFALGILLIDLMLPEEWKWANAVTAFVGVLFAAAGLVKVQLALAEAHRPMVPAFMNSMVMDPFAIYFWYLFLAGAAVAILMSVHYMDVEREHHGEFYALILFSVVGMMCMASGWDVVLIFIGLELMAISTYVLVGFLRRDRRSNEASLKYLLLGAFSSGIFAYGLSLLYGLTGSTNLVIIRQQLGRQLALSQGHVDPVAVLALLTVATGLLFKIAAVPFHQWAPDAYEGAPTSITGFMSVAVKSAAWAMLLRILLLGLMPLHKIWVPLLVFVSVATMTGANLAALTQNNLKRLLAYSSIAHVGYMLLGLISFGSANGPAGIDGIKGILIYLLVYTFMNLGAFAVITSLRRRNVIGDEIDDIAGLFSRAPVEAMLMLVFLLSLAGIPPLAGFWGKYFIFLSLIETGHYVLASLAVLYAVFGLYYYMRIGNAMLIRPALDKEPVTIGGSMAVALGVTALATLFIGIYPEPFIRAVNWSLGLSQHPAIAQLVK
ncbi:MAG TPA: NADH-quinone oxidoreductase subunit N [Terriglobales bacterium]|nr:NADH-quinone oxidoreductase subunit N [Terriglobales bacterium]